MKKALHSKDATQPAGAYSQAVVANGFVFTAGFGGADPVTGALPSSVGDQTRNALRSIRAVLALEGLGLGDLVKVTVHLADFSDFRKFDTAYRELVPEPFPVRTTVASGLHLIRVEIDGVAALRD